LLVTSTGLEEKKNKWKIFPFLAKGNDLSKKKKKNLLFDLPSSLDHDSIEWREKKKEERYRVKKYTHTIQGWSFR